MPSSIIPLGLLPSWLALASTGVDVLLLGGAVARWDAFDEGQALRADMMRSLAGCSAVAALFGGQALVGLAVTRHEPNAQIALIVLLFTSLAMSITVQVLADPLAGILDRLAFSKSPTLRADRAALRHTGAALPLRAEDPLSDFDDDTFARLTRRALGHLRRPDQAGRQPIDGIADDRRAVGCPRRTRSPGGAGQRAQSRPRRPHWAAKAARRRRFRHHRGMALLQLAVLPICRGACAHTRRTPPPPVWIRPRAKHGSGW